MYLSKIILDRRHPSIRQALRDCHDMHRNIQNWFYKPRKDAGILYRLNCNEKDAAVYVLSEEQPDQSKITNDCMKLVGSREVSDFEGQMTAGKSFHFSLLTSPCKKVPIGNSKNSRRRFLRMPEERAEWLQRHAKQSGFQICSICEKNEQELHGGQKESGMFIRTVEFEGILKITDPNIFRHSWENGIGPEKAYGMGLLLLVGIEG